MSETRCKPTLEQQGVHAVFKSETALRSQLVRSKDSDQKIAALTGFPVNAARCTSERLEDLCKTE